MIDDESITNLNKWIDDKERCSDTCRVDGQYSISQLDLDDFCDYLTEYEPCLVGIPCKICAEGIWFYEDDLKNASYL